MLRKISPILRDCAAYFRLRRVHENLRLPGYYACWRVIYWIRRKQQPHLTRKQIRRRYYGADLIRETTWSSTGPTKMGVERYRYRGTKIGQGRLHRPCLVGLPD